MAYFATVRFLLTRLGWLAIIFLFLAILHKPKPITHECPDPHWDILDGPLVQQIYINNHQYPIRYVPFLVDDKEGILAGEWTISGSGDRLIQISLFDQDIPEMQSTLLHEVLHGISYEYHLQPELTEQQVLGLELGLVETMSRNHLRFCPLSK
jgi:hypothetical protein